MKLEQRHMQTYMGLTKIIYAVVNFFWVFITLALRKREFSGTTNL